MLTYVVTAISLFRWANEAVNPNGVMSMEQTIQMISVGRIRFEVNR